MPQVKTKKTIKRVSKSNSKKGLQIDVYNIQAQKSGKISLPKDVFTVKVNPALLASTRKIYRQKGTGRARHGDIKAPIFIGGGVAHGPKIVNYQSKLSKKMRRLALSGALSEKQQEGRIKFVKDLDKFPPKTKNMVQFLQKLKAVDAKKAKKTSVLLVTGSVNRQVLLAGRNLPFLLIVPASQLNAYTVLKSRRIIFTQGAVEYFDKKEEKATSV